MRVLVTGATGFVGQWLQPELSAAGHEVISAPPSSELSIDDAEGILRFVASTRPDAVVHLAGIAHAAAAAADPERAIRTNVAGTSTLLLACAATRPPPVVVGVSSSEVYGAPAPDGLPLSEGASLRPRHVYGTTKLALEAAAFWLSVEHEIPVAIARPFNHTGPGQRPDFVVAGFVERVRRVAEGRDREVRTGNLDVQRDIGDVRDVVRAYRLLAERLAQDRPRAPRVYNVATGRGVVIGDILRAVCELLHVAPPLVTDPALVRDDDPPVIIGSSARLKDYTGWTPAIPLASTLAEMVAHPAQSDVGGR